MSIIMRYLLRAAVIKPYLIARRIIVRIIGAGYRNYRRLGHRSYRLRPNHYILTLLYLFYNFFVLFGI